MTNQDDGRVEAPQEAQTRRGFLKNLAAGSVAATATVVGIATAADASHRPPLPVPRPHPGTVKIFRLRTRGTVSCNACKKHHRYTMFATRKAAKHNRAHKGCDCPIEPQWILRKEFRRLFKPVGLPAREAVDLRKI
jgi:hypothetical protein